MSGGRLDPQMSVLCTIYLRKSFLIYSFRFRDSLVISFHHQITISEFFHFYSIIRLDQHRRSSLIT